MNHVSIVIPTYKSAELIARTIQSLLKAGVPVQNVYVVEDGVFDHTKKVLENFHGINHIAYEKNNGAPYARNLGLSKVKTKYVMFIDSDDFVSEDLITGLVNAAENAEADMTFGPWRYEGVSIPKGKLRQPPVLSIEEWVFYWLHESCIPTCSVLWNTSLIKQINGWDVRLRKNQDGEVSIRGLINSNRIAVSYRGYSTYWQHNSINRVSFASTEDRLFAAEIIYRMLVDWLIRDKSLSEYESLLGKYCCRTAWIAQSAALENSASKWLDRGRALGYYDKGYNKLTVQLAHKLGFKYAVIFKSVVTKLLNKLPDGIYNYKHR